MSTGLFTHLVFNRTSRSNYDTLVRHQRIRSLRHHFSVTWQPMRQPTIFEIDPIAARVQARSSTATFSRNNQHTAGNFKRFGEVFARYKTDQISINEMVSSLAPGDFAFGAESVVYELLTKHIGRQLNITNCDHCTSIDLRDVDSDSVDTSEVEGQTWCQTCVVEDAVWSDEMHEHINARDSIPYYVTTAQWRSRDPSNYVTVDYARAHLEMSFNGDCCASEIVRDHYPETFDPEFESDDDDYGYNNDGEGGNLISTYHHSNPRPLSQVATDGVNLGVELEIVSVSQRAVNAFVIAFNSAANSGRNYYCGFERDGSLESKDSKGVEVVTGYGSLAAHKEHLARVFNDQKVQDELANMDPDDSHCGMHVHITSTAMTNIHKLKLDKFVVDAANRTIWRRVAMRDCEQYAAFKLKPQHGGTDAVSPTASSIFKALVARAEAAGLVRDKSKFIGLAPRTKRQYLAEQWQGAFDRYRALNWQKGHTVEFRMFKGTMDAKVINARLELVRGLYAFTGQQNLSCLTWECFFEWAERPENIADMRIFLTWASEQGIIGSKDFYKPRVPRVPKRHGAKVRSGGVRLSAEPNAALLSALGPVVGNGVIVDWALPLTALTRAYPEGGVEPDLTNLARLSAHMNELYAQPIHNNS